MQPMPVKLRPAQAEVHQTAHDQDMQEIPKRARLDREAEAVAHHDPAPATTTQANNE